MIEQTLLIGFAAWRLTALMSYERGPFDIFLLMRERWLGFEHDDKGKPAGWPDGVIPRMVACPWCLGVWAVLLVLGLWYVHTLIVVALAAMAVLVVVEQWNNPR